MDNHEAQQEVQPDNPQPIRFTDEANNPVAPATGDEQAEPQANPPTDFKYKHGGYKAGYEEGFEQAWIKAWDAGVERGMSLARSILKSRKVIDNWIRDSVCNAGKAEKSGKEANTKAEDTVRDDKGRSAGSRPPQVQEEESELSLIEMECDYAQRGIRFTFNHEKTHVIIGLTADATNNLLLAVLSELERYKANGATPRRSLTLFDTPRVRELLRIDRNFVPACFRYQSNSRPDSGGE